MYALACVLLLTGLIGSIGGGVVPARTVLAESDVESEQLVASCPPPTGQIPLSSIQQAEQLLTGTWIRCSDTPLVPPPGPVPVGFDFAADGRAYRVYDDGGGGLIRVEGLDIEASWSFFDSGMPGYPPFLRLHWLGDGVTTAYPRFFGAPPLVQLDIAGHDYRYVPWQGAPPVPGVPDGVGDGPCGLPTDPINQTSVGQVEQLLVGTWLRCSATSAIGPPLVGEVGLEIASDGRFFRVYEGPDGSLIRAEGWDEEGTWAVIDTTSMNGPGWYQLNLSVLGRGTFSNFPTFMQQPSHLRLAGYEAADYQRWTGAPPEPAPLFEPVTPARLVDTRQDGGTKVGSPDGSAGPLQVGVLGRGGLPGAGVSAVSLNVTVDQGELPDAGFGFVTVDGCATPRPTPRNLNFDQGQTVPNAVITPVSATGEICVYVYGTRPHPHRHQRLLPDRQRLRAGDAVPV